MKQNLHYVANGMVQPELEQIYSIILDGYEHEVLEYSGGYFL